MRSSARFGFDADAITDRVRVHRSRRVAPSSRSGPRRRTQRSFLDTNMTAAHSRAARRHR
ncbi:hypothetical protein WT60_25700 [Burkholderia sp. MSMB617WGS]|uniref:Uncharacterized protein n=1 Tax=Burkholderia savannae TaxID=1637837 RepID=A0ABR5T5E9_9BURK|nr:hypothetical protein WT60_25700 [Burkholderia sp. MSMB617WGS]KVK81803.1 hypothetical protein WS91_10430 [Burkholderia sp. MSMB1498]KWZ38456.1 hypothetical protein WS72_26845 [Burkholderia savannae]KWZ47482.1 hypothetical protein WS73_02535 [Burkholderia savannae]